MRSSSYFTLRYITLHYVTLCVLHLTLCLLHLTLIQLKSLLSVYLYIAKLNTVKDITIRFSIFTIGTPDHDLIILVIEKLKF